MKRRTNQTKADRRKQEGGFFRFMEARIGHLEAQGKSKTARNCRCALKHLWAFRQGREIPPDEFSPLLMKDFQDYLVEKGLKMNTISLYMRMLRATYNYAIDEEIISEDRRPFRKVFTGQEKTRKRALTRKTLTRIMTARLPDPRLEFARDLFLFSLYMQGMPFADIAHLTKKQIRNGYIEYSRRKTHRNLKVWIDPHARQIIDKYLTADTACPYVFPILRDGPGGKATRYDSALRVYNKRLNRMAVLLGLDEPLTSYVSRHTWASLARAYGISDTVICEAMGHDNVATTAIYLASLDTRTIATANRKLIASLMRWRL